MIVKNFIIPIILIASVSCSDKTEVPAETADSEIIPPDNPDTLTYRIFYTDSIGWGYDVFQGSKLMIHQEHIPAIQGMKGFSTMQKADKAAQFILEKINRGLFPPTLSVSELDSLDLI